MPTAKDAGLVQPEFDDSVSVSKPASLAVVTPVENLPAPVMTSTKSDDKTLESPLVSKIDQSNPEDGPFKYEEIVSIPEGGASSDHIISSLHAVDEDSAAIESSDVEVYGNDGSSFIESDQHSPAVSNATTSEETIKDLPPLPLYVELTEEQQKSIRRLAVERIIESYKHLQGTDCSQTRMGLLARLIAQARNMNVFRIIVVFTFVTDNSEMLYKHVLWHAINISFDLSNDIGA